MCNLDRLVHVLFLVISCATTYDLDPLPGPGWTTASLMISLVDYWSPFRTNHWSLQDTGYIFSQSSTEVSPSLQRPVNVSRTMPHYYARKVAPFAKGERMKIGPSPHVKAPMPSVRQTFRTQSLAEAFFWPVEGENPSVSIRDLSMSIEYITIHNPYPAAAPYSVAFIGPSGHGECPVASRRKVMHRKCLFLLRLCLEFGTEGSKGTAVCRRVPSVNFLLFISSP